MLALPSSFLCMGKEVKVGWEQFSYGLGKKFQAYAFWTLLFVEETKGRETGKTAALQLEAERPCAVQGPLFCTSHHCFAALQAGNESP